MSFLGEFAKEMALGCRTSAINFLVRLGCVILVWVVLTVVGAIGWGWKGGLTAFICVPALVAFVFWMTRDIFLAHTHMLFGGPDLPTIKNQEDAESGSSVVK